MTFHARLARRVRAVGVLLMGAIALIALLAPLLAPFDPTALVGPSLAPPGGPHWLGTNDLGQDILSRLIHGARVSLTIGLTVAVVATALGTLVGLIAGLSRGLLDDVLMRLVDVMLVLPFLPLLIVLQVFLGAGLTGMAMVLVLVMWARPARELRAQTLSSATKLHVQAARSMGASRTHVLRRHLLPEVVPLVVPQFVRILRGAILSEASLSFLGLGDPTAVTWGSMLFHAHARSAYLTGAWVWWIVPAGLLIGLTVLSAALIGYALEEESRPRLTTDWRPTPPAAWEPTPGLRGAPGAALALVRVSVDYGEENGPVVDQASLHVEPGEVVGLTGHSGSGKSTLLQAAMTLLRRPARVRGGRLEIGGRSVLEMDEEQARDLRGRLIALVPQGSQSALNPVRTIRWQVLEALRAHRETPREEWPDRVRDLLVSVGIGEDRHGAYPHEFSGGMKQRVLIAMALANEAPVVAADEPTTGLDLVTQRAVLELLMRLRDERGLAVLLVSHDPAVVTGYSDRILRIHRGRIEETGASAGLAVGAVLAMPPDPDGAGLRETSPDADVNAHLSRERFLAKLISVDKIYPAQGRRSRVSALLGVSLEVRAGEALALVGMSGAGKSTLGRLLVGLEAPDAGVVLLEGEPVHGVRGRPARKVSRRVHLVFQDPYASLAPHLRVEDIVAEPLIIHDVPPADRAARVAQALTACGLPPARFGARYPHELSGGERQRVALARAFVLPPAVLVADEPTSLLDAPLRRDLQGLLRRLCREHGTALVYITHDIVAAASLCPRAVVLHEGRIAEQGPTPALFSDPQMEITRQLVEAASLPGRHPVERPRPRPGQG